MYSDPKNIEDYINKIKNAPNFGDVKKIMDDLYPTLFITLLDTYSDDYTDLNKNWNTMCDNLKVKKINSLLPEDINSIYINYVDKLNKIINDNPIKIYELQVRKINSDENIYIDNFNNLKKKIEINIYKSKSKILTEYEKLNIINNIDKNINFMNNLVYKYYEFGKTYGMG